MPTTAPFMAVRLKRAPQSNFAAIGAACCRDRAETIGSARNQAVTHEDVTPLQIDHDCHGLLRDHYAAELVTAAGATEV